MANTDAAPAARTPVDLITGFLGAGKTTLIRRYTDWLDAQGVSYVVLENEFGTAGVDAQLLGGNVRELSGGCICCGQKVNFHNLLLELAHEADRIIVEPSGVFNADDYFDIMDSPEVRKAAVCGMTVGVVDPLTLPALTDTDREVLYSELICCGAVLLSRTDLAGEAELNAAEQTLAVLLGQLPPVLDARTADFGALAACTPVRRVHTRMYADHSTLFQSAALQPGGVYAEDALRLVLDRLFSGEAGSVLRVKGTVRGTQGMLSVNASADSFEIAPARGSAALNVIGRGLSRRAIRAILDSLAQPEA